MQSTAEEGYTGNCRSFVTVKPVTPRNSINECIVRKLNQLVVVDFRLINLCIPVISNEFTR